MKTVEPIAVQLTADGKIPVPDEFRRALGWRPQQTIYLQRDAQGLTVQAISQQAIMHQILELMRTHFAEFDNGELLRGRIDDENRL